MSAAEESMQTMEQWSEFVAMCTGFKQQLVEAGWSDRNAERLVIETGDCCRFG